MTSGKRNSFENVFVTVGTTQFDKLIAAITDENSIKVRFPQLIKNYLSFCIIGVPQQMLSLLDTKLAEEPNYLMSRYSVHFILGTGLDDKSEQMTNRNDLLVRAFLDQFQ